MASTKAWVSGIATSAALSYVVMLMLRPDEVKIESMDKSFQNAKSKVSQVEVLKVAAHTDKPLYMLSKKEIDELLFSKREK